MRTRDALPEKMVPLPDRIKRGRFTSSRFSRHNLAVFTRLDRAIQYSREGREDG